MRPFGIVTAILFDILYRAAGVGLAYWVATETADMITALYAGIARTLPG